MSAAAPPATRSTLLRSRRELDRLRKGAQLLRRKREALVSELFRLARPAADARVRIAAAAERAYPALIRALAAEGAAGVRAIAWPARDYRVEIEGGSVWGVMVSRLAARPPVSRTLDARGTAPAEVGPQSVAAAAAFEELIDLLLAAAPEEMLLRRIGEALARTSRQVNTLERSVAPRLEGNIARVHQVLDEREREGQLQLRTLLRTRPQR